jgi:RimJ/RimL family protein N-acetyltransferase
MLPSLPVVVPDPPLAAAGVVLRGVNEGDVAWITPAWDDPDIARFIVEMPSPFMQRWGSGAEAELVIADAASGEPLGMVSLRVAERDPGLGAVGYWLLAAARGRGAATLAVRLVARWAFDVLGVQRLELTTAPDNLASQRVAERVGFTREGVLRGLVATENAGRRDNVMFSLLPAEMSPVVGGAGRGSLRRMR